MVRDPTNKGYLDCEESSQHSLAPFGEGDSTSQSQSQRLVLINLDTNASPVLPNQEQTAYSEDTAPKEPSSSLLESSSSPSSDSLNPVSKVVSKRLHTIHEGGSSFTDSCDINHRRKQSALNSSSNYVFADLSDDFSLTKKCIT
jgi:hypothetical protein